MRNTSGSVTGYKNVYTNSEKTLLSTVAQQPMFIIEAGYKDVPTDSEQSLMSTKAQQTMSITVETEQS